MSGDNDSEDQDIEVEFVSSACFGNEQFDLILTAQQFGEGVSLCEEINGQAASISSKDEFDLAVDFVSQAENSTALTAQGFFPGTTFVGLFDPNGVTNETDATDRFQWVDGTNVTFGSAGGELPWRRGEPNNFRNNIEDCVE